MDFPLSVLFPQGTTPPPLSPDQSINAINVGTLLKVGFLFARSSTLAKVEEAGDGRGQNC